jgi:predicted secreted hydrolase
MALPAAVLVLPARGRDYPVVRRGTELRFPADHGAHPDFRTEWWYITGWVQAPSRGDLGIQVTFFRARPQLQEANPSAFAPRQLLFAHAALADPQHRRLRHAQRSARAGFDLAQARRETTDVWLDDWSLRLADETYAARIETAAFAFDLRFRAQQPILLQGQDGFSRKGPRPVQASYYYSRPHLAVSGSVRSADNDVQVSGRAWLDHEWASEYMPEEARGWDWAGINLSDGGALMAFRMRAKKGGAHWAAATWRDETGSARSFAPAQVRFTPQRRWRSPRTGVEYPVQMALRVGDRELELQPLMDDQELDARASTDTIYWEGAVRAFERGREVGRGYLELTGYGSGVAL